MYIRLFKIYYKQVNQSILTPREIKKTKQKENRRKLRPKMKLHTAIRSLDNFSSEKELNSIEEQVKQTRPNVHIRIVWERGEVLLIFEEHDQPGWLSVRKERSVLWHLFSRECHLRVPAYPQPWELKGQRIVSSRLLSSFLYQLRRFSFFRNIIGCLCLDNVGSK